MSEARYRDAERIARARLRAWTIMTYVAAALGVLAIVAGVLLGLQVI